ncbi:hypothetical protein L3X38_019588 [Prunus dulcis]|uniref:Uncharacterized protein n=1 Tax=Prunus dulcis TaxID=3755 RepID=A0AAD4ZC69_PRUDU|nr:hypothetical protein L3X38_019588 [Prunus dulcis]
MAIIPVGSGPRRVPGPNGGSFRGEIGAGYGDPRIYKIPDRGWAGDGIVIPIPEPGPISAVVGLMVLVVILYCLGIKLSS